MLYKLRDKYVFTVGWGLRLYNIIFEAIDSVCTTCNAADEVTNTCTNTGSALGPSCSYVRNPTELCPGAATGSFIKFDTTPDTMRDDHSHVIIENCVFKDYLYEMKSFIEMNPFGGHVDIVDSDFTHFSFCGSLITNDDYYVYERTGLDKTDWVENWVDRSNNLQHDLFDEYVYAGWGGMSWGECSTGTGDSNDLCFDLKVSGSTFSYFGAHKSEIDGPLYVDPALH